MNGEVKSSIKRENWLYRRQKRSGGSNYNILNATATDLSNAVNSFNFQYHESLTKKIKNPKRSAKTYWLVVKTFVKDSKIPLIPPLSVGNQHVADFSTKTNV